MEDDETGRPSDTHQRKGKCMKDFWWKNLKERDGLKDSHKSMSTVKSVISGTSGTKGLPDIAVFWISEYYT
jgi:hypothetical protein